MAHIAITVDSFLFVLQYIAKLQVDSADSLSRAFSLPLWGVVINEAKHLNTGPSSFKLIQYNAYASTVCLVQLYRYKYICTTKLLCEVLQDVLQNI